MLNKIFINYRRADSDWPTYMIFNKLNEQYDNLVFKDINISGGENFEKRIEEELIGCKIFISVINKGWVDILKEKLGREVDYVLFEIENAIIHNKRVIPVLIDDTLMPSDGDLPESIKAFRLKNAVRISLNNFDNDFDKLCNEINKGLRNEEPLKRVLILDESSVRGCITLGLLQNLENVLNENKPQPKSLASYFDLIVSSGASSFIAVTLAMGFTVKKTFDLYRLYIEALFVEKNNLLNRINALYSIDKAKLLLNKILPSTTLRDEQFQTKYGIFSYNIDLNKVTVFTNFDIPALQSYKDLLIKDIILSSSTFPTYLNPYVIKTKDHSYRYVASSIGLSEDPSLGTALFIQLENETIRWNMNSDQLFFLSVGRGEMTMTPIPLKGINLLDWATKLPTIVLKNYANTNNSILSMVAKKIIPNKSKNQAIENILLSSLSIDSFLFTLSRVDLNLSKGKNEDKEFDEDKIENINLLYDMALSEKESIAEFILIKKYFE